MLWTGACLFLSLNDQNESISITFLCVFFILSCTEKAKYSNLVGMASYPDCFPLSFQGTEPTDTEETAFRCQWIGIEI